MNLDYFRKINNIHESTSRQETDLYLLNRHTNDIFDDSIDYWVVKKNGELFELLIIKDTDANTYKKKIKCRPGETFNLGDYIEWNDQIWLVCLVDVDDKSHTSGFMYLCDHKLRWQDENGNIIQRWVYVQDFTKYATGKEANGQLEVGDNQYGISIPNDDDTIRLRRDTRFVIDDLLVEPDVYILTNRKTALENYKYFNRGGLITLTLTIDSFNELTDKYIDVGDGEMAWICNYVEPAKPEEVDKSIKAFIDGKDTLRVSETKEYKRKYDVIFTDKNGNDITSKITDFTWSIDSTFPVNMVNGLDIWSVYLSTNYENLGETFTLEIIMNDTGKVAYSKEITVATL